MAIQGSCALGGRGNRMVHRAAHAAYRGRPTAPTARGLPRAASSNWHRRSSDVGRAGGAVVVATNRTSRNDRRPAGDRCRCKRCGRNPQEVCGNRPERSRTARRSLALSLVLGLSPRQPALREDERSPPKSPVCRRSAALFKDSDPGRVEAAGRWDRRLSCQVLREESACLMPLRICSSAPLSGEKTSSSTAPSNITYPPPLAWKQASKT